MRSKKPPDRIVRGLSISRVVDETILYWVDFKKDSLVEALNHSCYNRYIPTLFSWLGVTYYLTREVVFATLRDIVNVSAPGSTVIFDYLDSEAFMPGKVAKNIQVMQMIGRQLGEPLKKGFDPAAIGSETSGLSRIIIMGAPGVPSPQTTLFR